MPTLSAGILMYRRTAELLVLLVHPGGPFFRRRDAGAWSIPKGEVEPGEDLAAAACREFHEELGARAEGELLPLGRVRQGHGKEVEAFAVEGTLDVAQVRSNSFALEWPPRSGKMQQFPEIDRAAWFPLSEAGQKILPGQRPFLDRLTTALSPLPGPPPEK